MTASLRLLQPELLLSAVGLLLVGVDAFVVRRLKTVAFSLAASALAAALVLLFAGPVGGRAFGLLVSDDFSRFFKILAIAGGLLVLLVSEKDPELFGDQSGTFAALVLFSVVGTLFLASADDLLMLFVGMETTSMPLFVLSGFLRKEERSSEGAVKFLLMSAFSTGIMVYGMSLLYGLCGSTRFAALRDWFLAPANAAAGSGLFILAVLFLLAGLAFKLSLVPFHQWTPDTYEGAPAPVTAFFAVSSHAGVIAVLLRFFGGVVNLGASGLVPFFSVLAVLTMTVGNLSAFRQDSLKRLLAYSSVAHAGTILIGLVAGNELGREGAMVYSLAYLLMSVGAFAVVTAVSRSRGSDSLSAIKGLAKERFGLALLMVVFLLSLSGIPPFLGFWGKFYVFAAAVQAKMYGLVLVGLVNTVFAVYYYFRVAHAMFFEEPSDRPAPDSSWSLQTATALAAAAILVLGLCPGPVLAWVKATARFLP